MAAVAYISVLLGCLYVLLMLLYRAGWVRMYPYKLPADYTPSVSISVVIPARNEEVNIGACIRSVLAQDYPGQLLEIIVVDDHSADTTAQIVQAFTEAGVRYINLAGHMATQRGVVAYKKRALATGISQSKGELIVTTDADCIMGPQWLKYIAATYETQKAVMVVAPVEFANNTGLVQVFQSLDFMSMQGITAAAMQLNMGNMCNGANLAFTRKAYEQVGGYAGVDHLASGDDYLLMMKLNKAFPGQMVYVKAKEAIVSTPPQPTWAAFLQQRVRWASKSGKYDDKKITSILMLVYLFNLAIVVMSICSLFYPLYWGCVTLLLLMKIIAELWFLAPVAGFYGKSKQLFIFPVLQPLHILYIVSAGFLGFFGTYSWKGRTVK